MIQKIISGGHYAPDLINNSFTNLHGGRAWTTLVPNFASVSTFAVSGTLRKFRLRSRRSDGTSWAPAVGVSYTITVRKNEVNTDLEIVIDHDSYDATDMVNEVSITAGDQMDLKCVQAGGPIVYSYLLFSFEFESTNPKESVYFASGGNWWKQFEEGYFVLTPTASNPYANDEAESQQIIATDGKIKKLYLEFNQGPGSGAEAYKMTLMVNGSPTALNVTITGAATTGTDLSSSVSVSAGDLVCWKKEAIDIPTNHVNTRAGFAFEADTDGESLFINGYKFVMDTGTTKYFALSHRIDDWNVDEYKVQQYAQSLTVSKFYVRVSAAPGAGKSWTFKVRENGADTDIVVTISDSDTTGSDLANSVTVFDDDYLDISCTPSGTPAAAAAYFGAVQNKGAVISPDPSRVTALVIHWSAGPNAVYQEEVLTGGLFSQYFSPISPIKEPEATLPELTQNRQPARDILSRMVPTLREYGQWLGAHSQEEQRAILRGIPGADILTLRVWQEWVVGRRSMGKDI